MSLVSGFSRGSSVYPRLLCSSADPCLHRFTLIDSQGPNLALRSNVAPHRRTRVTQTPTSSSPKNHRAGINKRKKPPPPPHPPYHDAEPPLIRHVTTWPRHVTGNPSPQGRKRRIFKCTHGIAALRGRAGTRSKGLSRREREKRVVAARGDWVGTPQHTPQRPKPNFCKSRPRNLFKEGMGRMKLQNNPKEKTQFNMSTPFTHSLSHTGKQGSIPGGVAPLLSHVEIVLDDAASQLVFFRGSPTLPPLYSGAAPNSTRFTLVGSQVLDVKSRPNLFTHSFTHNLLLPEGLKQLVDIISGRRNMELCLGKARSISHIDGLCHIDHPWPTFEQSFRVRHPPISELYNCAPIDRSRAATYVKAQPGDAIACSSSTRQLTGVGFLFAFCKYPVSLAANEKSKRFQVTGNFTRSYETEWRQMENVTRNTRLCGTLGGSSAGISAMALVARGMEPIPPRNYFTTAPRMAPRSIWRFSACASHVKCSAGMVADFWSVARGARIVMPAGRNENSPIKLSTEPEISMCKTSKPSNIPALDANSTKFKIEGGKVEDGGSGEGSPKHSPLEGGKPRLYELKPSILNDKQAVSIQKESELMMYYVGSFFKINIIRRKNFIFPAVGNQEYTMELEEAGSVVACRVEHQPIRALTLASSVENIARAMNIGFDARRQRWGIRRITFMYFVINWRETEIKKACITKWQETSLRFVRILAFHCKLPCRIPDGRTVCCEDSNNAHRWRRGSDAMRRAAPHRSIVKTALLLFSRFHGNCVELRTPEQESATTYTTDVYSGLLAYRRSLWKRALRNHWLSEFRITQNILAEGSMWRGNAKGQGARTASGRIPQPVCWYSVGSGVRPEYLRVEEPANDELSTTGIFGLRKYSRCGNLEYFCEETTRSDSFWSAENFFWKRDSSDLSTAFTEVLVGTISSACFGVVSGVVWVKVDSLHGGVGGDNILGLLWCCEWSSLGQSRQPSRRCWWGQYPRPALSTAFTEVLVGTISSACFGVVSGVVWVKVDSLHGGVGGDNILGLLWCSFTEVLVGTISSACFGVVSGVVWVKVDSLHGGVGGDNILGLLWLCDECVGVDLRASRHASVRWGEYPPSLMNRVEYLRRINVPFISRRGGKSYRYIALANTNAFGRLYQKSSEVRVFEKSPVSTMAEIPMEFPPPPSPTPPLRTHIEDVWRDTRWFVPVFAHYGREKDPPTIFKNSEDRMERHWNARVGEAGVTRENPPASGITQRDSHMRRSGSEPAGYRTPIAVGGGGERPSHCATAAPRFIR
ncbi:hypothetical protein PR048_007706 [Dryococelus australis]|uniref:Uncharacterized protein n=1 Tax=Dryococelus australis TaxID=614101 RepID=A0ABQ9HVV9_9NEOP|nr:hypothetical protein PR048_007706 [Dryococelus australis]